MIIDGTKKLTVSFAFQLLSFVSYRVDRGWNLRRRGNLLKDSPWLWIHLDLPKKQIQEFKSEQRTKTLGRFSWFSSYSGFLCLCLNTVLAWIVDSPEYS